MVLQYTHLKTAYPYGLTEILLHSRTIVLSENLAGIKAGGEKGFGFALEVSRFENSSLLIFGFAFFLSLSSVV